jgi:hypothetical protein
MYPKFYDLKQLPMEVATLIVPSKRFLSLGVRLSFGGHAHTAFVFYNVFFLNR